MDGNAETKGLLEAVEYFEGIKRQQKKQNSRDAPFDFVNAEWRRYVFDEQHRFVKKYYELCVLFELRLNCVRVMCGWKEAAVMQI